MFKMKKVAALALSAVMAFSMVGCGSEKDDSDSSSSSKKGSDAKSAETIYDAFDMLTDYTKGSFDISMNADIDVEEQKGSFVMKSSGKVDGKNSEVTDYSMKGDLAGEAIDLSGKGTVVITDGRAYIDLDSIVKSALDVDTEFGSYGLLLPDEKDFKCDTKKAQELASSFIKAALTGAEITGEDGDFTAEVKDVEGYKKSAEALVNWLDANKGDIEALLQDTVKGADIKGYVSKLFDDIDEDLVSAADALGMGQMVNADTIGQIKDSLDAQLDQLNLEDMAKELTISDSVEDIKKAFADMTDEDWNKAFDQVETCAVKLNIKVDDDSYKAAFTCDAKSKEGEEIKLTFDYSFKNESVKIEKPDNAATLTDIAKYAMENKEVLNQIVEKVQSLKGKAEEVIDDYEDYQYNFE